MATSSSILLKRKTRIYHFSKWLISLTKACFKCGVPKDLSEFYGHPNMADGHLGKCKACTRADVIKNRSDKVDYYRAYEHTRGYHNKNPEYQREYRARNQEKYVAHTLLNNAVKAGKIVKPTRCTKCNSEVSLHGHHDDYAKPLDVEWLCPFCHKGPGGAHAKTS